MAVKARQIEVDRLYTNEEFEALPAEYEDYELINGKLMEKMPSGDRHGRIAYRLQKALILYDPTEQYGLSWRDTTFVIGPGFEPKPDLSYIVAERVPMETDGLIKVMPDLVVEVHSPTDMNIKGTPGSAARFKLAEYQKYQVRLIWVINPRLGTVEVYHNNQVLPVKVLGVNDILEGEDVIPGFKMPVANLLA